jgi:hypothetical protein
MGAIGAAITIPTITGVGSSAASVDPRSHGAKGDGIEDDTEAVIAAIVSAGDRDLPIEGGNAQFAVSRTIMISGRKRPWIKSLRLRQLRPADSRKTLWFLRCDQIRIDQLQIDLGTAKSSGYFNESAGLWIDGGSNHRVSNVEAFGAGKNSLISIWNTTKSRYTNFYVHDADFDDPLATDDVLQGIFLCRNSDCMVQSPRVFNLSGNASLHFPARFTRGLVLCGNTNVSIADADIANVDQGIDLTGSDGNRQCEVLRARVYQCNSVGVKLANSAVDCRVIESVAERCGLMGFFASGPAEDDLLYKTQDCAFIRCMSYEPGYNGFSDSAPCAGFRVERNRFDPEYPMGIRLIQCHAADRQSKRTMEYGFYDDVRPNSKAGRPNELIDCTSSGHIKAIKYGPWKTTSTGI